MPQKNKIKLDSWLYSSPSCGFIYSLERKKSYCGCYSISTFGNVHVFFISSDLFAGLMLCTKPLLIFVPTYETIMPNEWERRNDFIDWELSKLLVTNLYWILTYNRCIEYKFNINVQQNAIIHLTADTIQFCIFIPISSSPSPSSLSVASMAIALESHNG